MNDFLSKLLNINPKIDELDLPSPLVNLNPAVKNDEQSIIPTSDLKDTNLVKKENLNLPEKPDFNKLIETEIKDANSDTTDEQDLDSAISKAQSPIEKYNNLLKSYSSLKTRPNMVGDLTRLQSEGTEGANLFGAGAKVAQGLASRYGANIGDAQDLVKNLKEQNQQLPKNIEEAQTINQMAVMADPNSDISKFSRDRAIDMLGRLNPNMSEEQKNQLKNTLSTMSASDLEKIGFKGAASGLGTIRPFMNTDRVTKEGHPVKFDPNSGTYYDGITNRPISNNESIPRDIARKLEQTGNYGYITPQGAVEIKPSGSIGKPLQTNEQKLENKPTDVTETDLNKINPKFYKDNFLKVRSELQNDKDIESARKMSSNVTNILTKLNALDPKNPKVDSGIKEALAAQAGSISVGGGRLAEGVIKEFGGAGGIQARMSRYLDENFKGQMSPEDIKFFKDFSLKMAKAAQQDALDKSQIYMDQVKSFPGFEGAIDDANAAKLLHVDSLMKNTTLDKYYKNQQEKAQKTIIKKGYNPKTNQTQFIYSDGTKEIKDGKL